MRYSMAIFALVLTISAAAAADRYTGRYSGACGELVCELDVSPAGRDRWTVHWTATDLTDRDLRVLCELRTTVSIGSATIGSMQVDGIAVGRHRGRPFGLFDLDPGRVSWSSGWEACPGIGPKGIYDALGD